MSNLSFLLYFSVLYMTGLLILYFSKSRMNNRENVVYRFLILINITGLVLQIGCDVASYYYEIIPKFISSFLFKMFLVYFIVWINTMLDYLLAISFPKKRKVSYFNIVLTVIESVISLFLPFSLHADSVNKVYYTFGTAINYTFILSAILMTIMSVLVVVNYKKIKKTKLFPICLFIVLGIIAFFIQKDNPSIIIIAPSESFICILMYFTIENPDLQMLEQVEIAKEVADRASRAKTDFLSSMSHEIRTPLNAIVGFSQSLKTEDLPPSAMEEVDDIIEASETLLDTVNGVLDISKIEANKIEIVDSVYNFHKVFDELVALSKARLGESKPIDFRYELAEDTPKYLYGDYARVKQVVLNFLTNAIKYTNEGYIDFKVKNITSNGICRLIITVEDSGIGIKKESITKLFDKFERLDNENSTIEGTGLGMAITKKLVELMHGKIVVQSIYGKGSQFMVILDQKLVDEKDIPKEEETKVKTKTNDYSNKKVLIVDDNKLNLKVASRLLKPYNIQIEEADSGFACLDLIGGGKTYDLILMDDMMPKMSGKETFKKLKEDASFNIPVVILTANAISGMKEQYLAEGFNDYLAKPIEKSELERVLRKYLG